MARLAPVLATVSALLIGSIAQAAVVPQPQPSDTAVKHHWVGATVVDREGLYVGPIDRLVWDQKIVNAEIIFWGHRATVPLSSLTMREDGKAISTMRRYEIFLTYPGCNLCWR